MDLFVRGSGAQLEATFRVCDSACEKTFSACRIGTFNDEPVSLRFESANELCAAIPLGENVDTIVVDDDAVPSLERTCFQARETDQRFASLVFGSGMGGGLTLVDHQFRIDARDGFGRPVNTGGDLLDVGVDGPNRFEPVVTDQNNGSYAVRYAPDIGGYYDVRVTVNGQVATEMPERVSVTQASLCPLRGEEVRSRKPAFETAVCTQYDENSCCLRDSHYRDVARKQRDFELTFDNAECAAFFTELSCGLECSPAQAKYFDPNNNGTSSGSMFAMCTSFCDAWYNACRDVNLDGLGPVVGVYPTSVQFCKANAPHDDQDVVIRSNLCFSGKPAETSCRDSTVVGNGMYNWATGERFPDVRAGEMASFTIQAVDIYQNLRTEGGDTWSVAFDKGGVVPQVTDNNDGTYTVSYMSELAARFGVSVTCNGEREQVEHGPLPITVLPDTVYNRTELRCPLKGETGRPVPVTVVTLDRFGNILEHTPEGLSLTSSVSGPPSFASVSPPVTDQCDGTLRLRFMPGEAGTYTVILLEDNEEIDSCNIDVEERFPQQPTPAPPPGGFPCANNTIVENLDPQLAKGAPAGDVEQIRQFTIKTFDAFGRPTLDQTARFRIEIFVDDEKAGLIPLNPTTNSVLFARLFPTAPQVRPKTDSPGEYTVTYQTIISGAFQMFIYLDRNDECGGLVTGGPQTVPGTCDKACTVGGVCVTQSNDFDNQPDCDCLEPAYERCEAADPTLPGVVGRTVCCPTKPFVSSLRFTNAPSTAINVTWSTETDQAGMFGNAACNSILASVDPVGEPASGTLTALGRGHYCVWRNRRTLLVWLGSDATVTPDEFAITFRPAVRAFSEDSNFQSRVNDEEQANAVIDQPIIPPTPLVVVSGPELFNPCLPLQLNARFSEGTGGRDMAFEWVLVNADAPQAVRALVAQETGPVLNLPTGARNALRDQMAGKTLLFDVRATNHFGVSGPISRFAMTIDVDTLAPQVSVVPPLSTVARNRAYKLVADVAICADGAPDDRSIDYTWRQTAGPQVTLDKTTIRTLYIPAGALVAGEDYRFEVEAAYQSLPTLFGKASVKVNVVGSAIRAYIAGGNRLVPIGSGKPLILDGSDSQDPDDTGVSLKYFWEITRLDNPREHLVEDAVERRALLNPAATNGLAVVSVPASRLRAGSWRATLVVSPSVAAGGAARDGSYSIILTIVPSDGPVVRIDGPPGGLFSPSTRLQLQGVVSGNPRDGEIQLQWRAVGGIFDLEGSCCEDFVLTDTDERNLVIAPGAFGAGQVYRMRLEAVNDAGIGFAEIEIEANARPNAGVCLPASPLEGEPVFDAFSILCANWEDELDQVPLTYRAYRRPEGGAADGSDDFPLNVAPSFSPLIRFALVRDSQVVIEIADSFGESIKYLMPQPFTVKNTVGSGVVTDDKLLGQLERLLFGFEEENPDLTDADRLHNLADLLSIILKDNKPGMTRKRQDEEPFDSKRAEDLRQKLVDTIVNVLQVETTRDTVATRIHLLREVLRSGPLDSEPRMSIARFMRDTVSGSVLSEGVSQVTVTQALEVMSRTLDGAESALLNDPTFGESLRSSIEAMTAATLTDMIEGERERRSVFQSEDGETMMDLLVRKEDTAKLRRSSRSRTVAVEGMTSTLPQELADNLGQSDAAELQTVGMQSLLVRTPLFKWASGSNQIDSAFAVNGLTLYDGNQDVIELDEAALAESPILLDIALDTTRAKELVELAERPGADGLCLFFDGATYSSRGCEVVSFTGANVVCSCTHLTDFAAGLVSGPGDKGTGEGQIEDRNLDDGDSLWLLLLLLLLLWCALCIIFLLVLAHRKNKDTDNDTMQPYMDKASGAGALVPLVGADVSDSSELERRDYALPVGVYEVPDRTEDSDLERDDFSWALSGEDETIAAGGRGRGRADDSSEMGRADTYKAGRLAKMAGGDAGATGTKRDAFDTDFKLDGESEESNNAATMELGRLEAPDAGSKAVRD